MTREKEEKLNLIHCGLLDEIESAQGNLPSDVECVSEAYQISVMADGETVYQSQTSDAQWIYEASLRAQHLAAYGARHWHIGVAQISATQGAGYQSRIRII